MIAIKTLQLLDSITYETERITGAGIVVSLLPLIVVRTNGKIEQRRIVKILERTANPIEYGCKYARHISSGQVHIILWDYDLNHYRVYHDGKVELNHKDLYGPLMENLDSISPYLFLTAKM